MSIANNTVNLSEIMTTASDGEGVLGKIVFYGLGGIMIDREEFERLRAACQFSAPTNFRSTPAMLSAVPRAICMTGWYAARKSIRCTAVTTGSAVIPSAGN